jgi:hypothetical protein
MLVLLRTTTPADPDVMFSSMVHVPDGRAEHSLTAISTALVIVAGRMAERDPA